MSEKTDLFLLIPCCVRKDTGASAEWTRQAEDRLRDLLWLRR